MRLAGIAPLLTALFFIHAPAWAAEAKASVKTSGGSVSVGNPLSGPGIQAGQLASGLTAPGLVPGLKAPLGSPVIEPSKSASAPLPLLAPAADNAPVATMPELPKTVLPAPAPAEPGETAVWKPGEGQEGPPADEPALIKRARLYIRDMMGSRAPTEAETEVLLEDFMGLRDIEPASAQGQALRRTILASKLKAEAEAVAELDARYRAAGPFILAAAKEYGVAPARVVEAVEKRKLGGLLAGARTKEQADRILDSVLARDRFDRFLAAYPKNRQGDLMRDVASNMLVRSGKSIEEVSRDGVFVYADFNGRSLTSASVGRDPDPQTPNVLLYVRFEENKWRIDVYRQNRGRGFQGGADSSFVEAFQHWLVSGGVPKEHFR